ncbi:DUF4352 domain-containing protein [Salsuginibacillus kocurii]|uniref:DUF4352 domain-containing protein n=1 Tax=Salsuginibacillus kocurii TaxID=427078 RepID=UPI00037BDE0F|nr:DUF4352 domain-containing protein [Salsuginibacillus kocurii]
MQWKYVILVFLVFLLGFMSGYIFQSEETATTTATEFNAETTSDNLLAFGESKRIGDLNVTVHEAYEEYDESDNRYIVVDVSFFNPTEDTKQISLFNAHLVDEDGYTYEYDSEYGDQRLIGGHLRSGGQRRGTIAYEVPSSAYYEWIYTDHFGTGQKGWLIKDEED